MRQDDIPEEILRMLAKLEIIRDEDEAESLLARLSEPDRPIVLSFVNQHAFNLGWRTPEFADLLASADALLRDGFGMKLCLSLLGRDAGINMNGSDFIPRLLARFADRPAAVFGTNSPWLEAAVAEIARMGVRVVAQDHGFHGPEAYLEAVETARPELILLGMGMPKQERLARLLAQTGGQGRLIVNGGAILDFLAGRFPRAPRVMRATGSEWLFRLSLEPQRLWSRYGPGGFAFLRRVARLRAAARAASKLAQ